MSDNIKVVVKVRPLISREVEEKLSYRWRVKNNTLHHLDQNGKETDNCFTFDKVYDKETKTREVYDDIAKPIVEAAIHGFNGTIFAYGQTSSGKTYTMSGTEESPGIIPLSVLHLFEKIKTIPDRDFLVRVSYIEIYNETLKDLLNVEKKNIKIHETLQGVKVDATERVTSSPDEVLDAMREGEANRQTGATNMNEESSRSHSIFQITIESREHIEDEEEAGSVNVSQLNLVDLAGSERAGQTGATGLRFREGTHINKSLSVLALVIKQLSEDPNKYANYRDSKLTRILQNSLGGNAKTSIICAITPASVEETVSTLQFANRAKAIKNKPEVNAVATNATMIQSLTKQLSRLQAELVAKRNLEVMLESQKNVEQELQKQIVGLQKLILNGFGQRISMDIVGARRKPQALRRVTISTLHHIEEEPVPQVPKFCTPSLKYNPLALSTEFVPIQNPGKLAPVQEETRMITPPPSGKTVCFSDEIIEIDSDDDTAPDPHTCSPYHKCYISSKTPPCILRKNAKQAEKNLKDIVELTKREKIYTPTVVELMEKLEQNTNVIAQLEEEISSLAANGKSKDSKIEELNARIKKTEDEVKNITAAKLELENKCKGYDTQITDWEVSYDTLRNKSKRREQELLSLLEERKTIKKNEDIGKLTTIVEGDMLNFMDMSKDISLVNSDNESSLTQTNDDDASSQVQELVTDIQAQLATKNQTILELEANLFTQKQKIESLESSSQQLQVTIDDFKNKLSNVETENSFLKSTIDSLNETVESQKRHLESADKDIQSYNSTIQELQIKLTKKDNILNMKINDSVLENMIASEEKFIANNDNMKNIIHSFKIALENRNKEINNLKSTMQTNSELSNDNATLKEELAVKEKQICTLIEEAEKLNQQLTDNITVINNLMKLEKDLTSQLSTIQEQYESLNKINEENDVEIDSLRKRNFENEIQIQNLRTNCDELTRALQEKEADEQNISSENQQLSIQIENMSQKISDLEKDLNDRNILITAANKTDSENQEYTIRGKEIINRLEEMLLNLGSSTDSLPQTVSDIETVFEMLEEKINNLQTLLSHVIEEKNKASEALYESEGKLSSMSDTHKSEITQFKEQVETLNKEIMKQSEELSQQITQLTEDVEKLRAELENKNQDTLDLEIKLNDAKENNDNLRNDLVSKEIKISSQQENLSLLYSQLETLSQDKESEIGAYQKNKESFEKLVQEKDAHVAALENKLTNISATLQEKYNNVNATLKESIDIRDKLLVEILKKASKLTQDFYDENDALDKNCRDNTYEKIILTLDNIATHIKHLKTENDVERNGIAELLTVAQKQIEELTQRNVKLTSDYEELSDKNQQLLMEVERTNNLNKELLGTSQLLNQLTMELQLKSSEIEAMQSKVLEWKDHFKNYECVMKKQTEHFVAENDKLKDIQNRENKHQSALSDVVRESSSFETCQSFDENDLKSPQTLLTICCNKIIDSIQRDDTLELTPSTSKSSIELQNAESQTDTCACISLTLELSKIKDENRNLTEELQKATDKNNNLVKVLEELESSQKYLLQEREDVRKEIKLLMEPAQELQKKISNHKTNLSTLTATTYAENKLLNSQLKVLKHYHTRYIHVCQRDLPAFKTQLNELMTILKGSSLTDKQNTSFKRYSLPDILDNNTTMSTFKNESTLDGDLLMLDTNMTLATSADNTLVGHDQTCLDVTQINFDAEVACQTNELSKVMDTCIVLSQMETLSKDNQKLYEQIQALTQENINLKEEIQKLSMPSTSYKNAQSSPIKMNGMDTLHESICKNCNELRLKEEKLTKTVKELSQELKDINAQKENIEQKYNNLTLEIPSSDALVKKLGNTEKELQTKIQEINKLTSDLNKKSKTIRELQEENDSLSVQVMDNISEADNLNKELDNLKDENGKLLEEYEKLKHLANETDPKINGICPQCEVKDELIKQLQSKQAEHSKLNRSLSDSDSSSRHNKICTLQNELHASKEDCKKITEEVVTLKNQLERSNISIGQAMDLDESMGDSNIFTFTKAFDTTETAKFKSSVPEERPLDVYTIDKMECFNYFVETTGAGKENLDSDVKIIDVMKMFYNKLVVKHGNEVENLLNKLRDYEELKSKLQSQVSSAHEQYAKVNIELEKSQENVVLLTNVLNKMRHNISTINLEMSNVVEADKNIRFVTLFKDNLLRILDFEFGLTSANVFESLIDNIYNKHQKDLSAIMEQYTQLQSHMENVVAEFNILNENVKEMKMQLSNKESEYNLLKAQKERMFEISNAVTLDMVQKEKELIKLLADGCKKLAELNIISPCDIDATSSLDEKIKLLFESLINGNHNSIEIKNTKQYLMLEVDNLKVAVEEKEKIVNELKNRMLEIEGNLQTQTTLHKDLTKIYENKIKENQANLRTIETLTKEIEILKEKVLKKEDLIHSLETQATQRKDVEVSIKDADWKELLAKLESLKQDHANMKSINEIITKERDAQAAELEKAQEIIRKNKVELDKMTSDILVLRESVNDNVSIIETLTLEAKSLMEQNIQLKQQFNDKTQDCARLEMNIRTHEKTAEIQSKMIMRLQKQKEEDDKSAAEKDRLLEELTDKYNALQKECEMMTNDLKAAKEDVERLRNMKESLDARVSELEASVEGGGRRRLSDAAEVARRRRQSLHDSKRTFDDKLDVDDHNKIEAVFGARVKPDDLFMDVDEEHHSSNRSTPVRLSRGRDSFASRQDHSDKDEESSRPSSVAMTRRRRQSTHDLHRSLLRHTPSPSGRASIGLIEENNTSKPTDSSSSNDSEVIQLRERLASCQQELEELKDQYRELDEECETCAQYLREREDQCRTLKKDKTALERQVAELNEKLKSRANRSQSENKPNYANASVNTDEDWANLHSVVVDRMSFDAEVEKNKKLMRTIEELRCNKQELKNTVAKTLRALEKNAGYRESKELEATKAELASCRQQLAELQERYRELDEECETCGQYLREREEQCRKLREAKHALEAKIQELQEDASAGHAAAARRKRQSLHDQNRRDTKTDASTDTSDDLLSYQVERDDSSLKVNNAHAQELKRVKIALDKVLREKAALENQLLAAMPNINPTMYVATGSAIVQNQQITDVMKENQKLKKINAKLITICKKRGKSYDANRENEEPSDLG